MTIDGWPMRLAETDDLPAVVDTLNEAGGRLALRGLDQWGHNWMPSERMAVMIDRKEVYVAISAGQIIATVALAEDPGPFWTPEERAERVIYMGKLARRNDAPPGVGKWIMNVWVPGWAWEAGYSIVRLDAWRTNPALHDFYRLRGWRYVRTETVPGNKSGALFERPARPAPGQVAGTCDP